MKRSKREAIWLPSFVRYLCVSVLAVGVVLGLNCAASSIIWAVCLEGVFNTFFLSAVALCVCCCVVTRLVGWVYADGWYLWAIACEDFDTLRLYQSFVGF